jgi:hypothetical protein
LPVNRSIAHTFLMRPSGRVVYFFGALGGLLFGYYPGVISGALASASISPTMTLDQSKGAQAGATVPLGIDLR